MLRTEIDAITDEQGAERVAVAFHDYETSTAWSYRGSEWFHAASTIKVALLIGVYHAIEAGRFAADDTLHVRNRFLSAVEGEPFRIAASRDADAAVYSRRGKTMEIGELARHMIVTSSNLATNLLLDWVGADYVMELLDDLDADGVELKRGVEDEKAFQEGINNRATASGLLGLFRLIYEREALPEEPSQQMLDILYEQQFNSGIPAGLPDLDEGTVRVAHKTGEISTVAHDAGLVTLPERAPYGLVVLTEWERDNTADRQDTIAAISRLVYEELVAA